MEQYLVLVALMVEPLSGFELLLFFQTEFPGKEIDRDKLKRLITMLERGQLITKNGHQYEITAQGRKKLKKEVLKLLSKQ